MTFTKNFRRKHRRPICRERVSLDKNRCASYVSKKASSTRNRGRSSKKPSKTLSKNGSRTAFRLSRFGTDFGAKINEKSTQNRSKIELFAPDRPTWVDFGRFGLDFRAPGVDLGRSKRLGRPRWVDPGSIGPAKSRALVRARPHPVSRVT